MQIVPSFSIPSEFKKFMFVMFIGKTTSKKYPFILMELEKFQNFTALIDGQTWHIVGFSNTLDDLRGMRDLKYYTENLTNVFIYKDGFLWEESPHSLDNVIACALKATHMSDTCVYCCEKDYRSKEQLDHPLRVSISLGEKFDRMLCFIAGQEYVKPKFVHIKGAWLTNPCHEVRSFYNFNPYNHIENGTDLLEAYKALALKGNHMVFYCPFFKPENFNCEFVDEYFAKGDNN